MNPKKRSQGHDEEYRAHFQNSLAKAQLVVNELREMKSRIEKMAIWFKRCQDSKLFSDWELNKYREMLIFHEEWFKTHLKEYQVALNTCKTLYNTKREFIMSMFAEGILDDEMCIEIRTWLNNDLQAIQALQLE